MTELTATYQRTPISWVSWGANWRFPNLITYELLVGLVTHGLLIVAPPAGKRLTTGEPRRFPLY